MSEDGRKSILLLEEVTGWSEARVNSTALGRGASTPSPLFVRLPAPPKAAQIADLEVAQRQIFTSG
jgi:hypothetical protein